MRKNYYEDVASSAARTASGDFRGHNIAGPGAVIVIDVTAISATPSVVPTVRGRDPVSGKTWDILVGAAITATGTTVLRVHPSLTAVANLTAKDILPGDWQINMAHADGDSITYSISANYAG